MSGSGPIPVMDGSESEEEAFEDAATSFQPVSKDCSVDPIEGMRTLQTAIDLAFNNKFFEAEEMLKPWIQVSVYHAVSHGTIVFLQAVMSLERDYIEQATAALNSAVSLCNTKRKNRGVMESISNWVFGQRLDGYTLSEIHAELFYAESNLLLSILTFLQDENLLSFIKGGIRIRSCFSLYKQLHGWLETCKQEGIAVDPDFATGARMGIGIFNLIISVLPARVLKLLEFVGFSGNRELGLRELHTGATSGTVRAPLCTLFLLSYHTVGTVIMGVGDLQPEHSEALLNPQLEKYPTSAQFLYFKARVELMRGNVDGAIEWFKRCLSSQDQWATVHHLCWWELMWCHSFKSEWETAADFADKLFHDSKWSKATFLYQKASCILMQRKITSSSTTAADVAPGYSRSDVEQIMSDIPPLKQRIAGKSLPVEKFAVTKAERYLKGGWIPLSQLELMYAWNSYAILAENETLLKKIFQCTVDEMTRLEQTKGDNPYYHDDWCVITMLQGVCLRRLGQRRDAEGKFKAVIKRQPEIQYDHYAVAAASLELGLLYITAGRLDEAEKVLENTKSAYKGYHLESRIHFRIHAGLSKIAHLKAAQGT